MCACCVRAVGRVGMCVAVLYHNVCTWRSGTRSSARCFGRRDATLSADSAERISAVLCIFMLPDYSTASAIIFIALTVNVIASEGCQPIARSSALSSLFAFLFEEGLCVKNIDQWIVIV